MNGLVSQETLLQIATIRTKAREGTATREELRQALELMRADRTRAGDVSGKVKTTRAAKTAEKNIDSDALLGELGGL
jgi:hypothetical protein